MYEQQDAQSKKPIPVLFRIIAIFEFILGVLLMGTIFLTWPLIAIRHSGARLFGGSLIIFGLIFIFIGKAMWRKKKWALYATVILFILSSAAVILSTIPLPMFKTTVTRFYGELPARAYPATGYGPRFGYYYVDRNFWQYVKNPFPGGL